MRAVKVSYLMARSSDTVTYNINTNPILTHGVTPGSRDCTVVRNSVSVEKIAMLSMLGGGGYGSGSFP